MDENTILLESYKMLADFLCQSIGFTCSTVLYSVNEDENDGEVLAVFGPDTGRDVGDPMTVFLKQVLKKLRRNGAPGVVHVDTIASTAEGRVKLNIFAIRSSAQKIVGLFIICTHIDLICDFQEFINRYLGFKIEEDTPLKAFGPTDGNYVSLSDYMQQLIEDEIASFSVPVERMTIEEKRQLVRRLEKLEVFYLRDSVKITANLLGVSVPTVYRLLKKETKGKT